MTRVKDNKFVACALDGILVDILEQARSKGLHIGTVVHKVQKQCNFCAIPSLFLTTFLHRPIDHLRSFGIVEC